MSKLLTYENLNINIFTKLFQTNDPVLRQIFNSYFHDDPISTNLEFIAEYKSRKLSSFIKVIILKYGNFNDGEYVDISEDGIDVIVNHIISRFSYKWSKIYKVNSTDYNPLKPFNIELNESTDNRLETQKDKTTYVDNDETYAFNSPQSTPTDKTGGESNREYERTIDGSRKYTREGNIGNTSFQDLIQQERKIADYEFEWIILKDIATVICRGKYL